MGTDDELDRLVEREKKYFHKETVRLRRRWRWMVSSYGSPWLVLCFVAVAGYIGSAIDRAGSAYAGFDRFFNSNAALLFALGFLLLAIYAKVQTLVEQFEELLVIKRRLLDAEDPWLDKPLLDRIRRRIEAL